MRPSSVGRDGCSGGFYAVIPKGFVCVGDGATLDENDPLVRIGAEFPPDISRRLPYLYGTVRKPGPIYRRAPSTEDLIAAEPDLEKRMKAWLAAPGEIGAGYGQDLWTTDGQPAPDPKLVWETKRSDELPWFLADGRAPPLLEGKAKPTSAVVYGRMESRVGYSFLKTFLYQGRRYGLTTDLLIVPTDRLRPIQGSSFHGYRIPEDVTFPFAIVRSPTAKAFEHDRERNRLVAKGPLAYRSTVKLTGKQNFFRNRLHYETSDGLWVSDQDASRLEPAKRMPAWGKNGEKWIDVNVTKQTLVLYEGTRPVYATLVSTGEAGLEDAEDSTATRRGIFRIHTKYLSATMSSDEAGEEFELRDVPYVQYFEKGYALHGAYWHDRFGVPKSHGCINLSPEDARRIFFWTTPALPNGFHAVLEPLKGTVIFVHP
ncbi:MAG: L,D-transpeptidase [Polyangiaceae bacterium]